MDMEIVAICLALFKSICWSEMLFCNILSYWIIVWEMGEHTSTTDIL